MSCNRNFGRAAAASRPAGIGRLASRHDYWCGVQNGAVGLPALVTRHHRRQLFLYLWREFYPRCRHAAEVSSLTELLDLYFWGRQPRRKKLSSGEYLSVMTTAIIFTCLVSVVWLVREQRRLRPGGPTGQTLPGANQFGGSPPLL